MLILIKKCGHNTIFITLFAKAGSRRAENV
ncbi:Uncharacterised protein [Cronobacter universalis NCTC 9529]|uniref:Uncharacterized protein n=1 Tax=Cronobacter universalis NCTC 9529 TaxID=1074000 RepID=A0ABY1W4A7_9ENTR|nr:Uncharacterised protein [Cronobacter universalis NCTC 9529]